MLIFKEINSGGRGDIPGGCLRGQGSLPFPLSLYRGDTSAPVSGNVAHGAATFSPVLCALGQSLYLWTLIVSQVLPPGRNLPSFSASGKTVESFSV